jgi:hypothetical protein
MSRYDSIDCPICGKPLDSGEEIVVCPECGAPYHRSCYLEHGSCVFPDLHEKGEAWEAPNREEKYDGNASLRCSRCGTINPPHGIFCEVCGNKLSDSPVPPAGEQTSAPGGWQTPPAGQPPFQGGFGGFPQGMPLNPYTTPFGGVAPDEEIDGIPAKELAIFVGRNSHYFLPRFKELSRTRAKMINWSAFFFHGGYFLYRKMYLPAILVLLFNLLLSVPGTLLMMETMYGSDMLGFSIASVSTLTTANLLCSFAELAMRFFCGFLANTLYKGHCQKKITRLKAEFGNTEDYYGILAKKGSVATKLITGILIAYMALNFISLYLLIIFGGF